MILPKKVIRKPFMDLYPLPAVMVTSQGKEEKPNIITIAWTGILTSGPLVVYVSVRPQGRYSYHLIKESMEYGINIPTVEQARTVDYCGQVSGKDVDKFAATGLTPFAGAHIKTPLIAECPVNLECKVRQIIPLGNHDVFVADVLAAHYDEDLLDEKGRPDLSKIHPLTFATNEYYDFGQQIGVYGYSRQK